VCTVPYSPAGYSMQRFTVPSVFTVNGPFGVRITTSAGLTAVPFNVSLKH
jgi:hypothetical protein